MDTAEKLYRVRSVESSDGALLKALDAAHRERHGVAAGVAVGSASFHSRTGHSFIAEDGGEAVGFILASAIWTGGLPTVRVERLAGAEPSVLKALVDAVVKSAYDAGVYDLLAELPEGDAAGRQALGETMFSRAPSVVYVRTLGSRGQAQ